MNFRRFQAGPDPFDRMWEVEFKWQQNGITIRHADTVDSKFNVWTTDEPPQERVIAIKHPDLLKLSKETGRVITDGWVMKLAALHLKHMIETDEDMEKTLVTAPYSELLRYDQELRNQPTEPARV